MVYESEMQVSPGVRIKFQRTAPTFWGTHYVLCLHSPTGSMSHDYTHLIEQFNKDKFTLVACELLWDEQQQITNGQEWLWQNVIKLAEHAVTLMQRLFYTPFSILAHGDATLIAFHLAVQYSSFVTSLVIWNFTVNVRKEQLLNLRYEHDKQSNMKLRDMIRRILNDYQSHFDSQTDLMDMRKVRNVEHPCLALVAGRDDPVKSSDQARYLSHYLPSLRIEQSRQGTSSNDLHTTKEQWFRQTVEKFLLEAIN